MGTLSPIPAPLLLHSRQQQGGRELSHLSRAQPKSPQQLYKPFQRQLWDPPRSPLAPAELLQPLLPYPAPSKASPHRDNPTPPPSQARGDIFWKANIAAFPSLFPSPSILPPGRTLHSSCFSLLFNLSSAPRGCSFGTCRSSATFDVSQILPPGR